MDVVIPCIEKDKKLLRLAIEGLRENLQHPIDSIYLVVPDINMFKDFNDCKKVSETELVGFQCRLLYPILGNRSGWLYQQLIMLSADKIATTDDFLVHDADHILLKPHYFITQEDDATIFYTTDEYHQPYFTAIDSLFNHKVKKNIPQSFISDKMLLNKAVLNSMKNDIEHCCKTDWLQAIINNYQPNPSGFSEYETYGSFYSNYYPLRYTTLDANRRMSFDKIEDMTYKEIKDRYKDYASITEHKFAA